MKKALIAMSGGVDSSAAAYLMRRGGWDCHGVMLWLFGDEEPAAARDARQAAETLGMSFSLVDGRERFRREVMDVFAREYMAGRTPNPCIRCNRTIKFGLMLELLQDFGADVLATGHYARIEEDGNGAFHLLRAKNRAKDQSYFLYTISPAQLARVRFPLGEFADKDAVRALAETAGLSAAKRKDSQDVCFIPDGDYAAYLRERGETLLPGDFVDGNGTVLGRHEGLACYTRGQRKGLGVSAASRLYVIEKDKERNTVRLGEEKELFSSALLAEELFLSPDAPARVSAKTRYSHAEAAATLTRTEEGLLVRFDEPQRALTPGQAVVFYDGDRVLGGGTIARYME